MESNVVSDDDLKAFWLEFVVPALTDWRRTERDARLAFIALRELDIFAEGVLKSKNQSTKLAADRDNLSQKEPALGIARDCHDAHKHWLLNRQTARIKQRPKPYRQHIISGPIGSMPLGGSTVLLRIKDEQGGSHLVADVIDRCEAHWRDFLIAKGLLSATEARVPYPPRFGASHLFRRGVPPKRP